MQRVAFTESRAKEYFILDDLVKQTSMPKEHFFDVIIKELVDNALDETESHGMAPEVDVGIELSEPDANNNRLITICVSDNGPGMPEELIQKILDYGSRTSTKMALRSPLRGAQGNALKTIIGIPVALMRKGKIVIESRNLKHIITAKLDPAGNPRINHVIENSSRGEGTSIKLSIPFSKRNPLWWLVTYALLNPHVTFSYNKGREDENKFPALGKIKKYISTDRTSPHWYTYGEMERLIYSYINHSENGGKDFTLREFLMTFRGLQGNKTRKITDCIDIKYMSQFRENPDLVEPLFTEMKGLAATPKPNSLGSIGSKYMQKRLLDSFGANKINYKKITGYVGSIPFVVEVAFGFAEQGGVFYGTNFSPSYKDPTGNYSFHARLGKEYLVSGVF